MPCFNNISEAGRAVSAILREAGINSPEAETGTILSEVLNIAPSELPLASTGRLTEAEAVRLGDIVSRRRAHEPLQYILGHAYFMNIRLEVGPGVLIPRPETELMVERICRDAPRRGSVCDLGTGSGAIALALAYERPDLWIVALDFSAPALTCARRNRELLELNNVELLESDLFSAVAGKKFDYIAANLPYVSRDEYGQLPEEIRGHEPESALLAGCDGLTVIRRAAAVVPEFLHSGGKVIFEIGCRQAAAVTSLLHESGDFHDVAVIKDYPGLDRFIEAVRN